MRTRWRDGEFSSPVAIDLNECLPIDLLIETHFSGSARVADAQSSLCQLPSGVLRWQRPAVVTYPDGETQRQIWQMQLSLAAPTDEKNLAQRLYLTQRWMDLMMLEGFTPLPGAWGDLDVDLTLAIFRQKVNAALQKNDKEQACQLLDTYLSQLDKMSTLVVCRWFSRRHSDRTMEAGQERGHSGSAGQHAADAVPGGRPDSGPAPGPSQHGRGTNLRQ